MHPIAVSLLAAFAGAAPASLDLAREADDFRRAFPGAHLLGADGGGLEHASRLAVPPQSGDPERNARLFLGRSGRAFGVADGFADLETVRVTALPGHDGSAVFRRLVNGYPVFGSELAVGWRADGHITVVNGSRTLATRPAGAHAIDAARATAVALAAHAEAGSPSVSSQRLAGQVVGFPVAQAGWLEWDGTLLPVFRVAFDTRDPIDSFYAYVDAAAGRSLYRVSLTRYAQKIKTWDDSPLEPYRNNPPVVHDAENLKIDPTSGFAPVLKGARTEAFNCLGLDLTQGFDLANCVHSTNGDSNHDFIDDPDPTYVSPKDTFAEQAAYYHVDNMSAFFDSLDPAFASKGGIGFIPGYVNILSGGHGFDNAFFSSSGGPLGSAGVMVYGQGTYLDIAYDAEIVYHELTHAAVHVTAQFEEYLDPLGVNLEPGAINEGTADSFSFARFNDGCLSKYFGAEFGTPCLRQGANEKTCRGDGPNNGTNPGRDGEVHDDGEIWMGFTFALNTDFFKGGGEAKRMAYTRALFLALEVIGKHPGYLAFASTLRQKVLDTMDASSADLVDCVIAQREMKGCQDRAITLYSGERAYGFVYGPGDIGQPQGTKVPSTQQYWLDVPCDATGLTINFGSNQGKSSLLMRYGQPIKFASGLSSPTYDWRLDGNHDQADFSKSASICAECTPGAGQHTAFGAGRWYFLPVNGGGTADAIQLGISIQGGTPITRQPLVFGECVLGAGPVPTGHSGPPLDPPPITCEPPGKPDAGPLPKPDAGNTPPVIPKDQRGCGCGAGAGAGLLFLGAALLRRRRA